MAKLLLEVGAILAADDVKSGPGYILVDGQTIVEMGSGEYIGDRTGLDVMSRPLHLAMPGLVNDHGHAAMTLLRGAGDDMPLMTWLNERVFPLETKLTGEAVYWGTLWAAWEMIRSGTTTYADMYMFMHDAARAVEESGLRGVLCWGMAGADSAAQARGIDNAKSFIGQWNHAANGRITTTLGPHAPYTCPPDYLRKIAALARELDVPIQIHLSETRVEVENSLASFGKSPIAHVADCGLLSERVLAAHCVHVDTTDIELLAKYDVRVAHNPQSNLKLGSGIAPVPQMLQAGIIVGLGTDGACSNNNLDMFEEMRLAAMLHKGVLMDATVIPAAQAFAMATQQSARSLFLPDDIGTLAVGAKADIVLLSLDSPHFTPSFDPLSNVVYAAGADDVTDVIVDGVPVMRKGEAQTLDTERIRFEVKRLQEVFQTELNARI